MKMNLLSAHKQQGFVFVTGLVFLVVISLLGVTAMKTATLEERMAGNLRDRNLALQAAEMGLRYAEQHIRDNDPGTNVPNPIDGVTDFDEACTNGLCYYGAGDPAPGEPGAANTAFAWTTNCTPDCPIVYTAGITFITNGFPYIAPALPAGVLAPPTYLIEGIQKIPAGSSSARHYYRITVRAQGAQLGTVVRLQEIFRP